MNKLFAVIFLLGFVSSANAAFTNIGGDVIQDDFSGLVVSPTWRAFGLSYYTNYDDKLDLGVKQFGIYMVRNTNVAESYSLYLFMFGLLGLFSAMRTKRA